MSSPSPSRASWSMIASVVLLASGCSHAPPVSESTSVAVAPVPDPDAAAPYGPSHRQEAIAQAAAFARRSGHQQLDSDHASARFASSVVPGVGSGPIRCWTVVLPVPVRGAVTPPDATGAAPVTVRTPEYRPPGASPADDATVVNSPEAAKPRFALPSPTASPDDDERMQAGPGPALAANHPLGTPAPSAPSTALVAEAQPPHSSPPIMAPDTGSALAAEENPAPLPVSHATAFAPAPVVVFVLVDGQAVEAKTQR